MQALGKDRPRLSMPSLVISKLIFHKSLQSPSLFVSFQVLGLASCHAADRMLPGRGYEGLLSLNLSDSPKALSADFSARGFAVADSLSVRSSLMSHCGSGRERRMASSNPNAARLGGRTDEDAGATCRYTMGCREVTIVYGLRLC
jgi:hypothetical protein